NPTRQIGYVLDVALALALDLAQRRLAGCVLHVEEVDFAALAPADDSTGDADARALVVGQVRRQLQYGRDGGVAVEAAAPRIDAQFLNPPQLLGAAGLMRMVGCGGHGCGL